jgi:hypothetical protein
MVTVILAPLRRFDSSIAFSSELIQARLSLEKIESLADDVKSMLLELLWQNSGLAILSDDVIRNIITATACM